jgi:hypothetical protein
MPRDEVILTAMTAFKCAALIGPHRSNGNETCMKIPQILAKKSNKVPSSCGVRFTIGDIGIDTV